MYFSSSYPEGWEGPDVQQSHGPRALAPSPLCLMPPGAIPLSVSKTSTFLRMWPWHCIKLCAHWEYSHPRDTPQKLAEDPSCLQSKAEPSIVWPNPISHYLFLIVFLFCNMRILTSHPPNLSTLLASVPVLFQSLHLTHLPCLTADLQEVFLLFPFIAESVSFSISTFYLYIALLCAHQLAG